MFILIGLYVYLLRPKAKKETEIVVSDDEETQEKDKDKKIELVNEANKKLADVAIKNYQKLNAKLITAQTADSPLRFKIDPNL